MAPHPQKRFHDLYSFPVQTTRVDQNRAGGLQAFRGSKDRIPLATARPIEARAIVYTTYFLGCSSSLRPLMERPVGQDPDA